MYGPAASTGLSRYNNLLTKTASVKKPATSNGLPYIGVKQSNAKSFVVVKSSTKKSSREPHSGIMSPMHEREKLLSTNTRFAQDNISLLSKEASIIQKTKVQFRREPPPTVTSFREPDNRYLYIIPEGSDVTSIDLKTIRINLTDYVEILLPKDHTFASNPKMQRLGPYEKLEMVKPSKEMQDQVFRIILNKLEKV